MVPPRNKHPIGNAEPVREVELLENGLGTHEQFTEEEVQEGPSNRSFGVTVGSILVAIAVYRSFSGGMDAIDWIFLSVGVPLLLLGLALPGILAIPNRLWMGLGRVLFTIVNPVIMALMYAVCFLPMGIALKVLRYDPLHRRFDSSASTYWVEKARSETADPMKHQF